MPLNQFSGKQVKNQTLRDNHLASDAAISESKLSIDWNGHYHNALAQKMLVDYVQVNAISVIAGSAGIVIPHGAGAGKINQAYATTVNDYGVCSTYKVTLRDSATGEPLVDNGKEIYGVLTFDGAQDQYNVSFATGDFASPVAVVMPAGCTAIDIQYMCRFNLDTVGEAFAANVKFVDGMADVTDTQDLLQIIKDVFLPGYSLDHDGNGNNAKSVSQLLIDATHGTVNPTDSASDMIDEVIAARSSFGTINARFNSAESRLVAIETWKDTSNAQIHSHADEYGTSVAGTHYAIVRTDIKSTDFIGVYLNGARQYPGANFTKVTVGGIVTGLDFNGTLEDGWDVYIEAAISNS